jgi:hypothetical protein
MIGNMQYGQTSCPSHFFPTSGRVYVWRTPTKPYNPECLVPTVKHWDGYVMTWAAVSWYSVGPTITLNGRITDSDYI